LKPSKRLVVTHTQNPYMETVLRTAGGNRGKPGWGRWLARVAKRWWNRVEKLWNRARLGRKRAAVDRRSKFVMPPLPRGGLYDARTAVRICAQRGKIDGVAPTVTAVQLVEERKVNVSRATLVQRITKFRRDAATHGTNAAMQMVAPFGQTGGRRIVTQSDFQEWLAARASDGQAPSRQAVKGYLEGLHAQAPSERTIDKYVKLARQHHPERRQSILHKAIAGVKLTMEWAVRVEEGAKTVEIRTYPLPTKYLSTEKTRFIHIVATASAVSGGRRIVPCMVTFEASYKVTAEQLRGMQSAHQIEPTQLEEIIASASAKGRDLYAWQIGEVIVHSPADRAELNETIPKNVSVVWVTW